MKCDYFNSGKCQSCDLLNISYNDSLIYNENALKQLFPNHLQSLKPTISIAESASGSRNKAKLAVFMRAGKITFGFYRSDGSCQKLEACPLHAEGINALLPGLRDILERYKIIPYDLKTKTGELKYLLISSSGAGEQLLRFVLRSKNSLATLRKALPEILKLSSAIKVISANIQPVHQAILEGDEEVLLTDNKFITHEFDEFKLTLGTRSFFQVTSEIARKLYNAVAEVIKVDAPASLLDLYCGVGAFSFYAARHCTDVTGIEISKEAIACAQHSTAINQQAINFQAVDVESFLTTTQQSFDAVVINPPRRGLNPSIINNIMNIKPQFIYYSSCNAQTLARDFETFKENYQLDSLQIFDMFPHTRHYETLMCLQRHSV